MRKKMKLKKRVISFVIACSMGVMMIPAMPATKAEAGAIGDVLTGIVQNAGTIVNATKKSLKQAKEEQWNAKDAFLGASKNMLFGFMGLDEDESPGAEFQVNQVDLTGVEKSLGDIQNELNDQSLTLNKLQADMTANTSSILSKLDELQKTVESEGKLTRYYTYLNTYFSDYNDFCEAVRSNEKELTNLYQTKPSLAVIKNTYDCVYKLEGVKYTGNFYSAIERMKQYICGENTSLENGSLVDILYDYYKTAGYSDEQIADTIKEFVANTYYTMCLANYYYLSTALFQEGYMNDNNLTEYKTDFNKLLNQETIERNATEIMEMCVQAAEQIFNDMNKHFCSGDYLNVTYVGPAGALSRKFDPDTMDIEPGSKIYLTQTSTLIDKVFGDGYSDLFGDLCNYSYEVAEGDASVDGNVLKFSDNLKDGDKVTLKLYCKVGEGKQFFKDYTFTCKKGNLAGGYGTGEYPYIIRTFEQYQEFAGSAQYRDGVIVSLETDLDFEGKSFTPVSGTFSGVFMGNGHTISNIDTTGVAVDYGLFEKISHGRVTDLTLKNCNFNLRSAVVENLGAIAGELSYGSIMRSEVVDCTITGNSSNVGGIVGFSDTGTVTACIVKDSAVRSSSGSVGSLAGYSTGKYLVYGSKFEYSGRENTQVYAGSSSANVGGLVGQTGQTKFDGCWNYMTDSSDVSRKDSNELDAYGTLVGRISNTKTTNCSVYSGEKALKTNVNKRNYGVLESGDAPAYEQAEDFTLETIGLANVGALANDTDRVGNPVKLHPIEMSLVLNDEVKYKYYYGEPLILNGVNAKTGRRGDNIGSVSAYTVTTDFDPNKPGTYDVTVNFNGLSKSYQVTVAKKPHVYKEKIAYVSSCGAEGQLTYVCEDCGDEVDGYTIPKAPHTISYIQEVPGNCLHGGKRGYWQCEKCNKIFEDEKGQTEITDPKQLDTPLGDHTLTHYAEAASTCESEGNIEYWYCSVCKKYFKDEETAAELTKEEVFIPATGKHVPLAESNDCTVAVVCKVCGKTLTAAAKAHTWSAWTSDGKGNHTRHCTTANCKQTETKACTTSKAVKTVTKATAAKDGKIVAKCSDCKYTLSTTTIKKASKISLSAEKYTYDGKAKKPAVTVKDSAGKAIAASNYSVSYASGRKNVGSYSVTIKFKGNYSGTVKKAFVINPKATALSKVTAGKKQLTVTWKKQATQTTGYQIQYSTSSKFSSAKTKNVSKNSTTSQTISKLTAKKKYYVRIRTYKNVKVDGTSKKLYSGWSKAMSAKTE